MEIVKAIHDLTVGLVFLGVALTPGRFSLISPSEENKRTEGLIAGLGTL
jgi:hypothetical protein